MANVKSRLKAPKSAPTKKRRRRNKTKSLPGPNKNKQLDKETQLNVVLEQPSNHKVMTPDEKVQYLLQNNNKQLDNETQCNVVMKRPSNHKVMTPDEKVQYILQNGDKLKERFIAKQPSIVKRKPETYPQTVYKRKNDTDLPIMTKSGRLKKKTKCNIKLIDSILKNELMINDNASTMSTRSVQPPPLPPMPVNNNNDNSMSDQNDAFEPFSDSGSEFKLSGDSSTSDDFSIEENCADDLIEKRVSKRSKRHEKLKKYEKQTQKTLEDEKQQIEATKEPKQKYVTLKNGRRVKVLSFQCDHCKRSFNRKCSLRRHMFMHLGMKPFPCPKCPEKFRSRYNMQVHVERYHKSAIADRELFICHFCDEPFLVKKHLADHIAAHTHSDRSFRCIYCNKIFTYRTLLMQHEKKHLINGQYKCTLCSMIYRERTSLYLHIKSHLKIKDFVCQYCGKDFLRQNSLTRHLEISHGGHRIVCPICKKNLKGHLTEHMRTHEKKRPHVCPDCGQRFTQSTQLNVHRRAHTGARPYLCRICNRPFSHSNALMLHIRRHTGEKPFLCAMCPMSFSQLPHMKAHMRKIHGKDDPYKCAHCDTFFKLKVQLDSHEKLCQAGKVSGDGIKNNSKNDDEIVVEMDSGISLSRLRFLLALLLTMIATKEKLKILGFNKRLIDEILVESLEAMNQKPCKDETLSPLKRLKMNIEMLLVGTVPRDQMEKFKKEMKSTEDILELLTAEKK